MTPRAFFISATLLLAAQRAAADANAGAKNPVIQALSDELKRSQELKLEGTDKPYWIAYAVRDTAEGTAVASFGATLYKHTEPSRQLMTIVRVGSPALDGADYGGGGDFGFELFTMGAHGAAFPLEDNYAAMRHAIWLSTDMSYKSAVRALEVKRTQRSNATPSPDFVGDFTLEEPVTHFDDASRTTPKLDQLESVVKTLSALGKELTGADQSIAIANYEVGRRYFVSTEGTKVIEPTSILNLAYLLRAQASDGMRVATSLTLAVPKSEQLPPMDELVKLARRRSAELDALRNAPLAEDYTGPVLFEAPAAAQLIRQLLGTAVVSMGGAEEGSGSMELRPNQTVLPACFQVEDDPTIEQRANLSLIGHYDVDDDGVPAQRVVVIEHGKFVRYLTSRIPRKGFEHSNGHSRGEFAQIANLIVSCKTGVPDAQLKKRLIAEAKKSGQPYALVVRQLDSGAPGMMMAENAPAMAINEFEPPASSVYLVKLTPDGKEQPIRGAEFGELTVRTLKDILVSGQTLAVDNQADSESSVLAPSLLFRELEVKRSNAPRPKLPVVARPK